MYKLLISILMLFNYSPVNAQPEDREFFVFVGEQIELNYEQDDESWDVRYTAKYRILKRIYGNYTAEQITFTVYDHMGYPEFADYRHVMLIVFKVGSSWQHEKYQFFPLHKTSSKKWAFCGTPEDYKEERVEARPLENIIFKPEITYNTAIHSDEYNKENYPTPTFKYTDNRAICTKGIYLNELWRIKREGILKDRGYKIKSKH